MSAPSPSARSERWRRLGFRHDSLILLPAALLTLAALSTFLLFAYRSTVELLIEQRQAEADLLARQVAASGGGGRSAIERLIRLAPQARGVAVVDEKGRIIVSYGDVATASSVGEDRRLFTWWGVAPELPGVVRGRARRQTAAGSQQIWIDLPAAILHSRVRSLAILTWVVLGTSAAVVLLALISLRHLLSPIEKLIEGARDLGQTPEDDEVSFLLHAFERATQLLTDREQARETEEMEVIERTLARSLESGVMLLDRQARVLSLNTIGAAFLGVAEPATAGIPVRDLLAVHPELLEKVYDSSLRGRALKRLECSLEVAGESRTLGFSLHPLRRDDGSFRGTLMLFADLTASQQESERRLLAENLARVGEMAAGIAHEMRNSLATLGGYLTLVERGGEAESMADYVREIRHETDHIQRVVEDFLSFARPGTARMERLDLEPLLHRAAVDPALAGFPVRVRRQQEETLPWVDGDPQLLERALRNLLHNAVRAQRENCCKEPLLVTLEVVAEQLVVNIEDRGVGLSEEVRVRLFHPFSSGHPQGVGLGLALTHRIVELHGGTVSLEDRAGGGTRARVALPVVKIVTKGSKNAL